MLGPKSPKTSKVVKRARVKVLQQSTNMPHVAFNEYSKTGLGFDIEKRQQK